MGACRFGVKGQEIKPEGALGMLRVDGVGFRVQGLGFRVQGSGCRVQGAGCRVQGAGCRVQGYDLVQAPPECCDRVVRAAGHNFHDQR